MKEFLSVRMIKQFLFLLALFYQYKNKLNSGHPKINN